jgi:sugar/nucleoside kinase (ribokinase family)
MPPEIVTVGHVVNEHIRFPDRTLGPVLGGPASYTAVVASRLGRRTGLVTVVGADLPPGLLDAVEAAGVDMTGVKHAGAHTTSSLLLYDAAGDKEILYPFKASPIAFADLPPAYLDAAAFHVGAMDWDLTPDCLDGLARLNALRSIDLGGFGGVHSRVHPTPDDWARPDQLAALVQRFHIVRASLEDIRCLLGAGPERAGQVAAWFVQWGAAVGIVSTGADGAMVADMRGIHHVAALPAQVVDCTGAGDCFSMGFLVEYLRSRDALRAGHFAAAVAAHAIEGTGGVLLSRMPTLDDVRRRLAAQRNTAGGMQEE